MSAPVAATKPPSSSLSVDEAFSYCAKVTSSHYENFPVASLFLPEAKRPYIQSVYAFSRIADDFADEGERSREERLRDLESWEEQLEECYAGEARHPVFIALRETVRKLEIPIDPLRDLLRAFRQDVTVARYETFEELLAYCRCSANPVGRLVLMIFGYRSEDLHLKSDDVCTALQLANFWQDAAIDREKDRCYLPEEEMRRFGYSLAAWRERLVNDAYRALLKFQVERTKELFYRGALLPAGVERDLQLELKLVWFGGMRILRKIERMNYETLTHRPRLGPFDKLSVLTAGLFINDLPHYRRKRRQWDLA